MGTYHASIEIPPINTAPGAVRRLVAETLRVWGWSTQDGRADATLLASEIVTNAVEHAAGEVSLRLDLVRSDSWLRVSLGDNSSLRPRVREVDQRRPHGHGMRLVATVAQCWGVDHVPGGKRVWFEMDAEPPSSPAGDVRAG